MGRPSCSETNDKTTHILDNRWKRLTHSLYCVIYFVSAVIVVDILDGNMTQAQLIREQQRLREQEEERLRKEEEERIRKEEEAERLKEEKVKILI